MTDAPSLADVALGYLGIFRLVIGKRNKFRVRNGRLMKTALVSSKASIRLGYTAGGVMHIFIARGFIAVRIVRITWQQCSI
jgi:hypothetical protein